MKKILLICICATISLLLVGCGNKEEKFLCSRKGVVGSIDQKIEATLDSSGKVSTIQIITYYETEDAAKKDFDGFKAIHGDNAVLDGKTVVVKNAHDPNTFFGKNYSKVIGYTKEELETYLNDYVCE